jgi:hypothetical protein
MNVLLTEAATPDLDNQYTDKVGGASRYFRSIR